MDFSGDGVIPLVGDGRYGPDSVDCELFDCIQVNLAILADHHHGAGTSLNLGRTVTFDPRPGPAGLPTVDRPLAAQREAAERDLGVATVPRGTVTGRRLAEVVEPGRTCFAVGDAFELPWLPYLGNHHAEHGFLVEATPDGWVVTDGYRNLTQWGPAEPGRWRFEAGELAGLSAVQVFAVEPAAVTPGPVEVRIDEVTVDGYVAAYEAHGNRVEALDGLTAETWLLLRGRRLHAAARRSLGVDGTAEEAHLERWAQLVEQVYLAYRRAARGRPEPPGIGEELRALLGEDRRVFDAPTDDVADVVRDAVGLMFDLDTAQLADGTELRALDSFSSLRLVETIETVESRLGVELDVDDLVPANLRRVGDIVRIARRATTRAHA
jgi:acyl carrier protein